MPIRILIADDNEVFRKALRQLLEGVDHWEIFEAHDGQEAISKAVQSRPNVIILDLAMPVKDGLSSAKEISALLPETPILMCTMHMAPHLEAEARKAGVRELFSKSDSALLVPAIHQLLGSGSSQSSPLIAESIPPPPIPSTASPLPEAPGPVPSGEPVLPSPPLPKNVA